MGAAQRDRLYLRAVEQQAKLERKALERQRQLRTDELKGTTFSPQLTKRAVNLRTNGLSVEARMEQWESVRQAKLAEKVAASPTAPQHANSAPMRRPPNSRTGNPVYAANYANTPTRTVDSF